jgi:hypothetical protein
VKDGDAAAITVAAVQAVAKAVAPIVSIDPAYSTIAEGDSIVITMAKDAQDGVTVLQVLPM